MGAVVQGKKSSDSEKLRALKVEFSKLLSANTKLQNELEQAKNTADKNYNLFLQVSSYCACQKKAAGK
jgi:hypothetical protein